MKTNPVNCIVSVDVESHCEPFDAICRYLFIPRMHHILGNNTRGDGFRTTIRFALGWTMLGMVISIRRRVCAYYCVECILFNDLFSPQTVSRSVDRSVGQLCLILARYIAAKREWERERENLLFMELLSNSHPSLSTEREAHCSRFPAAVHLYSKHSSPPTTV